MNSPYAFPITELALMVEVAVLSAHRKVMMAQGLKLAR
jgi:hypothetical protein